MDAKTILKITRLLIGEIEPCSDPEINKERLENLNTTKEVVLGLIDDTDMVIRYKDSKEESIKIAGNKAHWMLEFWRNMINAYLKHWDEKQE